MVTEGGFNPVPLLVHVLAIALGLYVGWLVMGALSPDLPEPVDAAAGTSSAQGAVAGRQVPASPVGD